jgi:hypothetical protein
MSGMPEIIGEFPLGTLYSTRQSPEHRDKTRPSASANRACAAAEDWGTTMSPLRMRLHDFSGEGERAPP